MNSSYDIDLDKIIDKATEHVHERIANITEKIQRLINKSLEEEEKKMMEVVALKYLAFSEIPPYYYLLLETIIHSCICAVGYMGNIITCIVIASNKSMHTTTNIYLFNLAIADLIMLTSGLINYTIACWYPYKKYADFVYGFGSSGCFFFNWVSDVAVNVAIMTITAFTVERYVAICRPFLARITLSISKVVKLIFFIWIIGIIFGYLVFSQRETYFMDDESTPVCYFIENNIRYIAGIETLIFFVLPLILIAVLYILIWKKLVDSSKIQKNQGSSKVVHNRSEMQHDDGTNRQILKMLVTVVAVFFLVWTPYHIGRLFLLHIDLFPVTILEAFLDIDLYVEITYVIVYFSSSAINPIIYNVMSKKFRNAFKKIFSCWNVCIQKEPTKQNYKPSRERNTTDTTV